MAFTASWSTLIRELEELPQDATLITPLSREQFTISSIQDQRVVVTFLNRDIDPNQPLQREQFETLYRRITDATGGFELDRLPPDADAYPAVWSVHPRFEIDEEQGVIIERDGPTSSQLIETDAEESVAAAERTEPDLAVYVDALPLIDALEWHNVAYLEGLETDALVNIYTLLSDVQRNANELRQEVRSVLLDRLHHDQPVAGQYGSVQRTSRRNRSLKDDDEVLEKMKMEAAGTDRERVTSVDSNKVDEALDVVEVSESEVCDIEGSEYVRKAGVHDEQKETRLQGLKDQLAAAEGEETEALQQEISTRSSDCGAHRAQLRPAALHGVER